MVVEGDGSAVAASIFLHGDGRKEPACVCSDLLGNARLGHQSSEPKREVRLSRGGWVDFHFRPVKTKEA